MIQYSWELCGLYMSPGVVLCLEIYAGMMDWVCS